MQFLCAREHKNRTPTSALLMWKDSALGIKLLAEIKLSEEINLSPNSDFRQ
jgi:hypothetical protein